MPRSNGCRLTPGPSRTESDKEGTHGQHRRRHGPGRRSKQLPTGFSDPALDAGRVDWHPTGPTYEPLNLRMDRLVESAWVGAVTVVEC